MAVGTEKRPTLRTISQITGLAVTTVSRALKDAPDIGAKTKVRVREVAREIGYVPDRAGVRLRTGKTNVISLVLGTDHEVTDHTGQLVSSIARALRDTRYHLIVTPYFAEEDPMIPVRYIVETGSADAVILNRIEVEDPRIRYLMDLGFPFASYGRSKWRDRHPYFDFDNAWFGAEGVRTLRERGRQHLALLAPPLHQNYAQDMIAGATEAARDAGLPLSILPDISNDDSTDAIRAAVGAWIVAHPETDALICPSTTATIAATVAIEQAGLTIGTDIDLFAKEALPFLGHLRSSIQVVREDVSLAGTCLAEAAIRAIECPGDPPFQRLTTGRR